MSKQRVYVIAPEGRRIAGLGSRNNGAYFEVAPDLAVDLLAQPGFADRVPNEPAPRSFGSDVTNVTPAGDVPGGPTRLYGSRRATPDPAPVAGDKLPSENGEEG